MAKAFDLIFAPEDRYRVVLLQTALSEAGMPVSLRNKRWLGRSDPCLCVLSENSAVWLYEKLKLTRESIIWICLDETEPPFERGSVLDLRSWPGRSADGALTELVGVLKKARMSQPVTNEIQRRNRTVLGILAFVLALAFLLPSLSSETEEAEKAEKAEEELLNELEVTGDYGVADSSDVVLAPASSRHMGYADPRLNSSVEDRVEPPSSAAQGIQRTGIPAKNDPEAEAVLGKVVAGTEQPRKSLMCIAPANYGRSEA